MIPRSCLETLQKLLGAHCQVPRLEAPLLERFYRYCLRRPIVRHHRRVSLPLTTLLQRHAFLRPEVKAYLNDWIADRWHDFEAEIQAEPPAVALMETAPSPIPDPAGTKAPPALLPEPHASSLGDGNLRPGRPDGFERFLDTVRVLLFL